MIVTLSMNGFLLTGYSNTNGNILAEVSFQPGLNNLTITVTNDCGTLTDVYLATFDSTGGQGIMTNPNGNKQSEGKQDNFSTPSKVNTPKPTPAPIAPRPTTTPAPTKPKPVAPKPTTTPAPATPKPAAPRPTTTPAPATPKPAAPRPTTTPAPATPKPAAPKPTTTPAPATPKPAAPKPTTSEPAPKPQKTNQNTNVKGGGR